MLKTREEILKECEEIDKRYKENFKEKIICPICKYKYSKFLPECPECVERRILENDVDDGSY